MQQIKFFRENLLWYSKKSLILGIKISSGSRPNQTAQSWGLARLASSITAGKSAAVDFNILEKGCQHNKKAFVLAKKSRKKYKFGHSKTKKVTI